MRGEVALVSLLLFTGCVRFSQSASTDGRALDGAPARDGMATALEIPEDCSEPRWPAPGRVVKAVPGDALEALVAAAGRGTTILLADGRYSLAAPALFSTPSVVLRGQSGAPDRVTIDARGIEEPFTIAASDVVLADLSIINSRGSSIVVTGAAASAVSGTVLHRLSMTDPAPGFIRARPSSTRHYADAGLISCSTFTLSDSFRRAQGASCSARGVALEGARGWRIRDNHFRGLRCSLAIDAGVAIILEAGARDTIVERNRIQDCRFGVRVGAHTDPPTPRVYADGGCSYQAASPIETIGAVLRNNFISSTLPGIDSGINVWNSCDTQVVHNTVHYTVAPFSCIEWRFANTRITVKNNLVSHNLRERDGALAETSANRTGAVASFFTDAASGDLHLSAVGAAAVSNQGVDLPAGLCDGDIDRQSRGDPPEIGADEL